MFPRRKGSLWRNQNRKTSRVRNRRAMRREMRKMSPFQTMTCSTVQLKLHQDVQEVSDGRDREHL